MEDTQIEEQKAVDQDQNSEAGENQDEDE